MMIVRVAPELRAAVGAPVLLHPDDLPLWGQTHQSPGRSFSDRGLLRRSILDKLLVLPAPTIVKTGHGDDTTIADEKANLL